MCKDKLIIAIQSIITAVAFVTLSISVFGMTGHIVKPIFICVAGSLIICLLSLISERSIRIVSNGLLIFMMFWLLIALIKEFVLQIQAGFVFDWIYFFYFDKLLILGTIWLTATVFFCIKRLTSEIRSDSEYLYFFKTSSKSFFVFYAFLLIYSFILIRLQRGEYPFRFQPFVTIKEYISNINSIPYEVFMMFFGNLLYFTPLGYIISNLIRNKSTSVKIIVNIIFPLTIFTLLEFSQYVFKNGYCEFDDMMMNSIGFWLGSLLFMLSNKFASFVSKGRYNSFWN